MKNSREKYEKAKQKAKEIYKKIGAIPCPLFGGEKVVFANKGFDHLIYKGRVLRPLLEQHRRFNLLAEHAERMVRSPSPQARVEYEEKEIFQRKRTFGSTVRKLKMSQAWAIIETIRGKRIKLIIRQVEGRQKEFLSIMTN